MKKRVKKIPLYSGHLRMYEFETHEQFEKETGIKGIFGYNGLFFRKETKNRTYFNLAIMKGEATPGLIAHEALHATNGILHDTGIDPSHLNDEAQAYLLSWVVNRAHEFFT